MSALRSKITTHRGGSPWSAGVKLGSRSRNVSVALTKWDSAAGYGRHFGPLHVWRRGGTAQAFVTLRRARYGRDNARSAMYLRLGVRA